MYANSPSSYGLSALLHGTVIALIIAISLLLQQQVEKAPKIFELVAGEGDNYAATAAPALGGAGGVKITIPEPESAAPTVPSRPEPVEPVTPVAPEPVAIERAPITPAPPVAAPKAAPKVVAKPPPDTIRDFSKDVKRIADKRQKKLAAADKKLRELAEKKAAAAEARKMTKEEFDKQNKGKGGPTGPSALKVSHVGEGIATGVMGGSAANKTGGAGGKALTREEGDELDAYFSLLKRRLKEALDKPPGLSDSLVAIVEVRIAANGLLSGAKITRSSGSEEFDHAALAAIARVKTIGARPDGKSEVLSIPFRMREEDDG
jgi:colicin import membrane protein